RGTPQVGQATSVELVYVDERSAKGSSLRLGDQFQPMGLSGIGDAKGPIVFVGFGITSEKLGYDDYKDVDVNGKVVLMIRRAPRYGDKDRPFADEETVQQLAALTTKLSNAEKHKAAAVLFVNDAGEKDDALMDFGYA